MLLDMAILRSPTFMDLPWRVKNIWRWDKIVLKNIMQLRRGTCEMVIFTCLNWVFLFIVSISSLIRLPFWFLMQPCQGTYILNSFKFDCTENKRHLSTNKYRDDTQPFFWVSIEKAIYLWSINMFHPHKTFCMLEKLRFNETAETHLELYALASIKNLLTWLQICFLLVIATIATLKDRENITTMIFWKGLVNFRSHKNKRCGFRGDIMFEEPHQLVVSYWRGYIRYFKGKLGCLSVSEKIYKGEMPKSSIFYLL